MNTNSITTKNATTANKVSSRIIVAIAAMLLAVVAVLTLQAAPAMAEDGGSSDSTVYTHQTATNDDFYVSGLHLDDHAGKSTYQSIAGKDFSVTIKKSDGTDIENLQSSYFGTNVQVRGDDKMNQQESNWVAGGNARRYSRFQNKAGAQSILFPDEDSAKDAVITVDYPYIGDYLGRQVGMKMTIDNIEPSMRPINAQHLIEGDSWLYKPAIQIADIPSYGVYYENIHRMDVKLEFYYIDNDVNRQDGIVGQSIKKGVNAWGIPTGDPADDIYVTMSSLSMWGITDNYRSWYVSEKTKALSPISAGFIVEGSNIAPSFDDSDTREYSRSYDQRYDLTPLGDKDLLRGKYWRQGVTPKNQFKSSNNVYTEDTTDTNWYSPLTGEWAIDANGERKGTVNYTDTVGHSTFTKNAASMLFESSDDVRFAVSSTANTMWFTIYPQGLTNMSPGAPTVYSNDKPLKDVYKSTATDIVKKDAGYAPGSDIEYVVTQKVNNLNYDSIVRYNSFSMNDTVPDDMIVESVKIERVGPDNQKATLGTNQGTWTYKDANGNVVPNVADAKTFTYEFKNSYLQDSSSNGMPLKGEEYVMTITGKVKDNPSGTELRNSTTSIINGNEFHDEDTSTHEGMSVATTKILEVERSPEIALDSKDEIYYYTVSQMVPHDATKVKYEDTLDPNLEVISARLVYKNPISGEIMDAEGSQVSWSPNTVAAKDGQRQTVTATVEDLPSPTRRYVTTYLRGENVTLLIEARIRPGTPDDVLIAYENTQIPNTGKVTFNDDPNRSNETNEVYVTPPFEPQKSIIAQGSGKDYKADGSDHNQAKTIYADVYDDAKGVHVDTGEAGEHFTYTISQAVPKGATSITFVEKLDDALELVNNQVKVYRNNQHRDTKTWTQKGDGTLELTITKDTNPGLFEGVVVTIVFDAKFKEGKTQEDIKDAYETVEDNKTETISNIVVASWFEQNSSAGNHYYARISDGTYWKYSVNAGTWVQDNGQYPDSPNNWIETTPSKRDLPQDIRIKLYEYLASVGRDTYTRTISSYSHTGVPNSAQVKIDDGELKNTNKVTVATVPEKKVNGVDSFTLENRDDPFTYTVTDYVPANATSVTMRDVLNSVLEVVAKVDGNYVRTSDGLAFPDTPAEGEKVVKVTYGDPAQTLEPSYYTVNISSNRGVNTVDVALTPAGVEKVKGANITFTFEAMIKRDETAGLAETATATPEDLAPYITSGIPNKATVTLDNHGRVTNEVDVIPPDKGDLEITKTVKPASVITAGNNPQFKFTVTLRKTRTDNTPLRNIPISYTVNGGAAQSTTTNGDGQFEIYLRHGETAVIKDLPAGTHYTIVETPATGFALDRVTPTGYDDHAIQNGETIGAEFINQPTEAAKKTIERENGKLSSDSEDHLSISNDEVFAFTVADDIQDNAKTVKVIDNLERVLQLVRVDDIEVTLDGQPLAKGQNGWTLNKGVNGGQELEIQIRDNNDKSLAAGKALKVRFFAKIKDGVTFDDLTQYFQAGETTDPQVDTEAEPSLSQFRIPNKGIFEIDGTGRITNQVTVVPSPKKEVEADGNGITNAAKTKAALDVRNEVFTYTVTDRVPGGSAQPTEVTMSDTLQPVLTYIPDSLVVKTSDGRTLTANDYRFTHSVNSQNQSESISVVVNPAAVAAAADKLITFSFKAKVKDSVTEEQLAEYMTAQEGIPNEATVNFNGHPRTSNKVYVTTPDPGDVKITKAINIEDGVDTDKQFAFTVELYAGAAEAVAKNGLPNDYAFEVYSGGSKVREGSIHHGGTIEIAKDETALIKGLPAGGIAVFTEQDDGQYTPDKANATVAVQSGVTGEASAPGDTVTNTSNPGNLSLTKEIPNPEDGDEDLEFVFHLTFTTPDGQPYTDPISTKIDSSDATDISPDSNGVYRVDLKNRQIALFQNLPSGTSYTVQEMGIKDDSNPDGFVPLDPDTWVTTYTNSDGTSIVDPSTPGVGQGDIPVNDTDPALVNNIRVEEPNKLVNGTTDVVLDNRDEVFTYSIGQMIPADYLTNHTALTFVDQLEPVLEFVSLDETESDPTGRITGIANLMKWVEVSLTDMNTGQVITIDQSTAPDAAFTGAIENNRLELTVDGTNPYGQALLQTIQGNYVTLKFKAQIREEDAAGNPITDEYLYNIYGSTTVPNKAQVNNNWTTEVNVTPPSQKKVHATNGGQTYADDAATQPTNEPGVHATLKNRDEIFHYSISQTVPENATSVTFTDTLESVLEFVNLAEDKSLAEALAEIDAITDPVQKQQAYLGLFTNFMDVSVVMPLVDPATGQPVINPDTGKPYYAPVSFLDTGLSIQDLAHAFTAVLGNVTPQGLGDGQTLSLTVNDAIIPDPQTGGQTDTTIMELIRGKYITVKFNAKIRDTATDDQLYQYTDNRIPNYATILINGKGKATNTVTVTPPPTKKVNGEESYTLTNRREEFTYTVIDRFPSNATNIVMEDNLKPVLELVPGSLKATNERGVQIALEDQSSGQLVKAKVVNDADAQNKTITFSFKVKIKDDANADDLLQYASEGGVPNTADIYIDGTPRTSNEVTVTPPPLKSVEAIGADGSQLHNTSKTNATLDSRKRMFTYSIEDQFGDAAEVVVEDMLEHAVMLTDADTYGDMSITVTPVVDGQSGTPVTYTLQEAIDNGIIDTIEKTYGNDRVGRLSNGFKITFAKEQTGTDAEDNPIYSSTVANSRVAITFNAKIRDIDINTGDALTDAEIDALLADYTDNTIPNDATFTVDNNPRTSNTVTVTPPPGKRVILSTELSGNITQADWKEVVGLNGLEANFTEFFTYGITHNIHRNARDVVVEDTIDPALFFAPGEGATDADKANVRVYFGETLVPRTRYNVQISGQTISVALNNDIPNPADPTNSEVNLSAAEGKQLRVLFEAGLTKPYGDNATHVNEMLNEYGGIPNHAFIKIKDDPNLKTNDVFVIPPPTKDVTTFDTDTNSSATVADLSDRNKPFKYIVKQPLGSNVDYFAFSDELNELLELVTVKKNDDGTYSIVDRSGDEEVLATKDADGIITWRDGTITSPAQAMQISDMINKYMRMYTVFSVYDENHDRTHNIRLRTSSFLSDPTGQATSLGEQYFPGEYAANKPAAAGANDWYFVDYNAVLSDQQKEDARTILERAGLPWDNNWVLYLNAWWTGKECDTDYQNAPSAELNGTYEANHPNNGEITTWNKDGVTADPQPETSIWGRIGMIDSRLGSSDDVIDKWTTFSSAGEGGGQLMEIGFKGAQPHLMSNSQIEIEFWAALQESVTMEDLAPYIAAGGIPNSAGFQIDNNFTHTEQVVVTPPPEKQVLATDDDGNELNDAAKHHADIDKQDRTFTFTVTDGISSEATEAFMTDTLVEDLQFADPLNLKVERFDEISGGFVPVSSLAYEPAVIDNVGDKQRITVNLTTDKTGNIILAGQTVRFSFDVKFADDVDVNKYYKQDKLGIPNTATVEVNGNPRVTNEVTVTPPPVKKIVTTNDQDQEELVDLEQIKNLKEAVTFRITKTFPQSTKNEKVVDASITDELVKVLKVVPDSVVVSATDADGADVDIEGKYTIGDTSPVGADGISTVQVDFANDPDSGDDKESVVAGLTVVVEFQALVKGEEDGITPTDIAEYLTDSGIPNEATVQFNDKSQSTNKVHVLTPPEKGVDADGTNPDNQMADDAKPYKIENWDDEFTYTITQAFPANAKAVYFFDDLNEFLEPVTTAAGELDLNITFDGGSPLNSSNYVLLPVGATIELADGTTKTVGENTIAVQILDNSNIGTVANPEYVSALAGKVATFTFKAKIAEGTTADDVAELIRTKDGIPNEGEFVVDGTPQSTNTVTVTPPPEKAVDKDGTNPDNQKAPDAESYTIANRNDTFTYTITQTFASNATQVVLTDELEPVLKYIEGSLSAVDENGDDIALTDESNGTSVVGKVNPDDPNQVSEAAGKTVTFTFQVQIDPAVQAADLATYLETSDGVIPNTAIVSVDGTPQTSNKVIVTPPGTDDLIIAKELANSTANMDFTFTVTATGEDAAQLVGRTYALEGATSEGDESGQITFVDDGEGNAVATLTLTTEVAVPAEGDTPASTTGVAVIYGLPIGLDLVVAELPREGFTQTMPVDGEGNPTDAHVLITDPEPEYDVALFTNEPNEEKPVKDVETSAGATNMAEDATDDTRAVESREEVFTYIVKVTVPADANKIAFTDTIQPVLEFVGDAAVTATTTDGQPFEKSYTGSSVTKTLSFEITGDEAVALRGQELTVVFQAKVRTNATDTELAPYKVGNVITVPNEATYKFNDRSELTSEPVKVELEEKDVVVTKIVQAGATEEDFELTLTAYYPAQGTEGEDGYVAQRPLTGTFTLDYEIDDPDHTHRVKNVTFEAEDGDVVGEAIIQIHGGETATIKNLPAAATVEIAETNIPAGFELVGIEQDDTTGEYVVTNQGLGGFTVEKTVLNTAGDPVASDETFTFKVEASNDFDLSTIDGLEPYLSDGVAPAYYGFNLTMDGTAAPVSKTFTGVPQGVTLTITEVGDAGYTPGEAPEPQTIVAGETATFAFDNTVPDTENTKKVGADADSASADWNSPENPYLLDKLNQVYTYVLEVPVPLNATGLEITDNLDDALAIEGEIAVAVPELPEIDLSAFVEKQADPSDDTIADNYVYFNLDPADADQLEIVKMLRGSTVQIVFQAKVADPSKLSADGVIANDFNVNGEPNNKPVYVKVPGAYELTKVVGGETDKEFKFTLTADPALNGEFSATYTDADDEVVEPAGSQSATVEFTDGVATVYLYQYQTIRIADIPLGTTITATEDLEYADPYTPVINDIEVTVESATEAATALIINETEPNTPFKTVTEDADPDNSALSQPGDDNTITIANMKRTFTYTVDYTLADNATDLIITDQLVDVLELNGDVVLKKKQDGSVIEGDGVVINTAADDKDNNIVVTVDNDAIKANGLRGETVILVIPAKIKDTVSDTELVTKYPNREIPNEAFVDNVGTGKVNVKVDEPVDLTVNKVVQGTSDDTFHFTVTVKDEAGDPIVGRFEVAIGEDESLKTFNENGEIIIALKGGQSAIIKGLPKNYTFTVVENDPRGYEVTYEPASATIDGIEGVLADDTEVTVTNAVNEPQKKVVTGEGDNQQTGEGEDGKVKLVNRTDTFTYEVSYLIPTRATTVNFYDAIGGEHPELLTIGTFGLFDAEGNAIANSFVTEAADHDVANGKVSLDLKAEEAGVRGTVVTMKIDASLKEDVTDSMLMDAFPTTDGEIPNTATVDGKNTNRVLVDTPEAGNLEITKQVLNRNGEVDNAKASDVEFKFLITLKHPSGNSVAGTYNYVVTDAEGNTGTTKTITFVEGTPTEDFGGLKIKAGETITIIGLPDGTTYEVAEDTIEGFTEVTDETAEIHSTGKTGAISEGSLTEVKVVNTIDENEPEKLVNGKSHEDIMTSDEVFTYTVDFKVPANADVIDFADTLEPVLTVLGTNGEATVVKVEGDVETPLPVTPAVTADENDVQTLSFQIAGNAAKELRNKVIKVTFCAKIKDGVTENDLIMGGYLDETDTIKVPNEATFTINNDGEFTTLPVTITPPAPGNLAITKNLVAVDKDGNERAVESDDTFPIFVTLNAVNGTPINDFFTLTEGTVDGEILGTVTFTNGLSEQIDIKAGQTLVIAGIPDGASYNVVEGEAPEGYQGGFYDAASVGTIATGETAATTVTNKVGDEEPEKKVNGDTATITLENLDEVFYYTVSQKLPANVKTASFTDPLDPILVIAEKPYVIEGAELVDGAPTVAATIDAPGINEGGTVTATLSNAAASKNKVVTLVIPAKIKPGATADELAPYITAGGVKNTAEVTVNGKGKPTNDVYVIPPEPGTLTLTKSMIGDYKTEDAEEPTFTFKVTFTKNGPWTGTVKVDDVVTTIPATGIIEVPVKANQTVTISGIENTVAYMVEEINVQKPYEPVGNSGIGGEIQAGVTHVENLYNKVIDTPVEILKVDEKGAALKGATLTLTGGPAYASVDEEWITSAAAKTFSLKPGTYTITETEAPAEYNVAAPITFTIADDGKVTSEPADAVSVRMVGDVPQYVVTMVDQPIPGPEPIKIPFWVTKAFDRSEAAPEMGDKTFTFNLLSADQRLVEAADESKRQAMTIGGNQTTTTAILDTITITNEGEAKFSYEYEALEAGTYTFFIQEVKGTDAGILYDDVVRTVTVVVEDNIVGEIGSLYHELTMTSDEGNNPTISNSVTPPGSVQVTLSATKMLERGTLENGMFKFKLTGPGFEEGVEVVNGSANDASVITFPTIVFGRGSDAGATEGTYEYTITEINEGNPAYTYDATEHTATVEVEFDEEHNQYTASVTYDEGSPAAPEFVNKVNSWPVEFLKVNEAGSVVAGAGLEVHVGSSSVVAADAETAQLLQWTSGTEAASYSLLPGTYTLVETSAPQGYELAAPVTFVVNSDGTIDGATDGIQVQMVDKAKTPPTAPIQALKKMTDGSEPPFGAFSFQLKPVDGYDNPADDPLANGMLATNGSGGVVDFGTYTFGTTMLADGVQEVMYMYQIEELVTGGQYKFNTEGHTAIVQVTVSYDANGTPKADVLYGNGNTFYNEKDDHPNTTTVENNYQVPATKTLDGKAPGDARFEFKMESVGAAPSKGAYTSTKENDAIGAVLFDAVTFDESDVGKTFEFKVTEVIPGDATYKDGAWFKDGVFYDSSEYHVFMAPYYTDASKSNIGIRTWTTKDGQAASAITFNNPTEPETPDPNDPPKPNTPPTDNPTPTSSSTPTPKTPSYTPSTSVTPRGATVSNPVKTGDPVDFAGMLALMGAAAVSAAGMAYSLRRSRKEQQ